MSSRLRLRIQFVLLLVLITAACSRPTPSPVGATPAGGEAGTGWSLKVVTNQAGIYRVGSKDLQGMGVDLSAVSPDTIHLYRHGVQVPFWMLEDGIAFFASQPVSIYSRENYTIMTTENLPGDFAPAGSITPTEIITGLHGLPGGSYPAVLHLEENIAYQPQAEGGDHWFWANLPATQSHEMVVSLENLVEAGTARLELHFWSNTEAPANPDHHIVVNINGQVVGDATWDAPGRFLARLEFDASVLHNGANQIVVQVPGDLGLDVEISHLDWITLIYPRTPEAKDGYLEFILPEGGIQFSGFRKPVDIYDTSAPGAVRRAAQGWDPARAFSDQAGHRYIAVSADGYLEPEQVSALDASVDLRAPGSGADYIAMGPPEFLSSLQPLLELRASQGLKTAAIPLQAMYDQFNGGYPEPQAINNFIRHAREAWNPAPRYLLLVGDASYDPRGYISPPEANHLPAFLVETVFGGQTASDVGFVQLNDDPWPDMAVGRVPARTVEQVKIFVEKTIAYETALTKGVNSKRVLAIADGQEASFKEDAQAFLDLFTEQYASNLFSPAAGVQNANQEITSLLGQGDFLVAYFGHGSVNMWGKDRLFTTGDVEALPDQPQYPIVINMTCLTGLFTHPKTESLSEAFLWRQGGGAVAVLAPSSLTLPTDQSFLSHPFVASMLKNPGMRLGDVHLEARRQVPVESLTSLDVMLTFMLFGDPALRLSLP